MKNYFTLVFLFSFTLHFAQNVGINTNTPAATLDINGNAMIKTVPKPQIRTVSAYSLLN
jgi:hypothetical protein